MFNKMFQKPCCADHILTLLHCLPFNLNTNISRHVGNKDNHGTTSVDSALFYLIEESSLGSGSKWITVRVGLEFIQSFLTFVPDWTNASEIVDKQVGDLVPNINYAFETAGLEIKHAAHLGVDAKHIQLVRSSLLEKIELFKPRIRETYGFFDHLFRNSRLPIIKSDNIWSQLCDHLRTNASHLNSESHLISSALCVLLQDLITSLQVFREACFHRSSAQQWRDLGIRVEHCVIFLACILFSWWADGNDGETDQTSMLLDLLQTFKPIIQEASDLDMSMRSRTKPRLNW